MFPGQVGRAEPWASGRQAPLAHSLCQRVAATGSPLVLADVRQYEQVCGSAAIGDLGLIAFAGMPLTDSKGHVLGLCARLTPSPGPVVRGTGQAGGSGCGMLRGAEAADRVAVRGGCAGRG